MFFGKMAYKVSARDIGRRMAPERRVASDASAIVPDDR
jgi:hypothetical protein